MKKLRLHNDNNKLHCNSFIHVCLYQGVDVWSKNVGYEVYWRHTYLGEAKIIEKRVSTISKLNESVSAICTGWSKQALIATLAAAADRSFPVTEESKIHIITFKYVKLGAEHPLSSATEKAKRARTGQLTI